VSGSRFRIRTGKTATARRWVTQLAAQLGHSKKSLTFDVYSHVLIDER
jgi:hypothetical protein